ncbi:MAG TPA: helix-turn-helix transcriptional regulator, partial [Thermoanaerobaculia bacterium]|nr:helix-turn-helix transcriptional regulator [Thermoanaerobaculia bacterium]
MADSQRIARQVGGALRRVRMQRRQRQYRVAEAAGISRGELAAYERGRQQPSVAALAALLRVLGCSAEDFGRHLGP